MRSIVRAAACAALACASTAALAVPQVVLVQNSGWMEPFYSDPSSPFKPLVTALVTAVVQPGDALVLASFNQALPGAPSPKALLSLKADPATLHGQVRSALSGLRLARKPGSTALADTDLGEAVNAALTQVLGGKAGIVWLVTNNRNISSSPRSFSSGKPASATRLSSSTKARASAATRTDTG